MEHAQHAQLSRDRSGHSSLQSADELCALLLQLIVGSAVGERVVGLNVGTAVGALVGADTVGLLVGELDGNAVVGAEVGARLQLLHVHAQWAATIESVSHRLWIRISPHTLLSNVS